MLGIYKRGRLKNAYGGHYCSEAHVPVSAFDRIFRIALLIWCEFFQFYASDNIPCCKDLAAFSIFEVPCAHNRLVEACQGGDRARTVDAMLNVASAGGELCRLPGHCAPAHHAQAQPKLSDAMAW